ncbi:MAG TPA: hypothetical protein VJP60_07460 [Rhizomicrobium sp.]|nr:hypothetical protein [Rhizomicrobium sp.]
MIKLFRYLSLAVVLAAGGMTVVFFHYYLTTAHSFYRQPGYWRDLTEYSLQIASPWFVMAALQAISIRKTSWAMDLCRALAIPFACWSLAISWPLTLDWHEQMTAPHPDGLAETDLDVGLDVMFSYPLSALTLATFLWHKWRTGELISAK